MTEGTTMPAEREAVAMCGTCQFWSMSHGTKSRSGVVTVYGDVCRRHPTHVKMNANDWCGEHKPKGKHT